MKVRVEDMDSHLARGVKPIYLVTGDEPLQVGEACDAVRRHAREQGFTEREVLQEDTGSDWSSLYAAAHAMSLFAERRVLEVRIPSGKPGDKGAKALVEYAERPADDTVLLIVCGKLAREAQNTKWFKQLDQAGVVVQVWPLNAAQLPAWITRRMRARGLQPSSEAVELLAERVEGNLLAAAQEIEKLVLLQGAGPVSAAQMADAVGDSARFDVYGLVDAALSGEAQRCARMITGLRAEGVEPILVLWAMAREIRALAGIALAVEQGRSVDDALMAARVWDARKPVVRAGLKRHTRARFLHMLRLAARVDRMVKGQEPGNAWDELVQLALVMAGVRLFPARVV